MCGRVRGPVCLSSCSVPHHHARHGEGMSWSAGSVVDVASPAPLASTTIVAVVGFLRHLYSHCGNFAMYWAGGDLSSSSSTTNNSSSPGTMSSSSSPSTHHHAATAASTSHHSASPPTHATGAPVSSTATGSSTTTTGGTREQALLDVAGIAFAAAAATAEVWRDAMTGPSASTVLSGPPPRHFPFHHSTTGAVLDLLVDLLFDWTVKGASAAAGSLEYVLSMHPGCGALVAVTAHAELDFTTTSASSFRGGAGACTKDEEWVSVVFQMEVVERLLGRLMAVDVDVCDLGVVTKVAGVIVARVTMWFGLWKDDRFTNPGTTLCADPCRQSHGLLPLYGVVVVVVVIVVVVGCYCCFLLMLLLLLLCSVLLSCSVPVRKISSA